MIAHTDQGQGRLLHGGPGRLAPRRADQGPARSGDEGIESDMSAERARIAASVRLPRRLRRRARSRSPSRTRASSSSSTTASARRSSASFRKRWPERTINVGIAEQNMVGVGSGLANGGKIPFVSAASCFLTGRALEQIKADVAYTQRQRQARRPVAGRRLRRTRADPSLDRGLRLAAALAQSRDRRRPPIPGRRRRR